MANASNPVISPSAPVSPDQARRAELSEIDASTRSPVLLMLGFGLFWLLIGTVFALISSFKLHSPHFLGDYEWLTFGRARSAHLNAMNYGWGVNACVGIALWVMARLSRGLLRHKKLLLSAITVWNLGVAIGVFGILRGDSTSVEWLEFPPYASPLLFIGYALIGGWAILTFRFGKAKHIYVSQWYILAALFWFPWLYSIAEIMIIFAPARGTVQALVNWWFAHNVLGLWLTPIGLASIYYFLPKVLGKPIHSYYLSIIAFWTLAIFYNWAGVHHLIGGPVPVWVQSAGIAASFMMVVPVVMSGVNYHFTTLGSFSVLKTSPTLRFIVFGAMSYTVASLQGSSMAIRSFSEVTHFTHYTVGHSHVGMYAFITMTMFGAIYYVMPRLLLKEWPSAKLISVHFWTCGIGVILYVVALSIGGVKQGLEMNNPNIPFIEVVKHTIPYLETRSYAGVLMTIGHIAFAVNFIWMFLKPRARGATAPTLFRNGPDIKLEAATQ